MAVLNNDPYTLHWNNIRDNGRLTSPRGKLTTELLNAQMKFIPGYIPGRAKMNRALGFMELLQFIAGKFDVANIAKVAPKARLDLFEKQSDYGPRTISGIDDCIKHLRNNRKSRRAIFMFPSHREGGTDTLPCTLTGQFIIRDRALFSTFNMRSSDAVFGVVYDVMMFGGLALAVARTLGCNEPGVTTINFASAHIYKSTDVLLPLASKAKRFRLATAVPFEWNQIRAWASQQIQHAPWPDKIPLGIEVLNVQT